MLSAFLFLAISNAYGVIGPKIPVYEHPPQVCVIKYAYKSNLSEVSGVCSGVLVKSDTILTAGHCLSDKTHSPVPIEVLCPNGESTKVKSSLKNPNYIDVSKSPESSRRQDLGAYILSTKISTPPINVVKNDIELKELLKSSSTCGLFGYGGRHPLDEDAFESQGSYVSPSSVEFRDGVLWIHSFKGLLGGMVLPGDSGGSFACKNKKNEWVHLGQISAVSYDYESLIAPAYLSRSFLKLKEIKTSSLKKHHNEKNAFQIKLNYLIKKTQHLHKKGTFDLKSIQAIERKLGKVSKINLTQENIHQYKEELNILQFRLKSLYKVQFEANKKYFVNKFTHIKTTKSTVLSQNGKTEVSEYDTERLSKFRVFNTGDNPSNQLNVKSVDLEKGRAFGTLKVQGTTQHYGCVAMILCRKKIISNVYVNLEDLRL